MLAIQSLPRGAKIRLKKDAAMAELVDNPCNGARLLIRRTDPAAAEALCHVDDILEILPGGS